MTKYTAPEFGKAAFNCPHCGAYAHMEWRSEDRFVYYQAICAHCEEYSLWRVTQIAPNGFIAEEGEMLYPDFGSTPLPAEDMPEDVKKDYEEAARIFIKSPRGAAALLRLGLQRLCTHLGEGGENINADIRSLVKQKKLSGMAIKIADTVRITGNNAVHPGEISDEDIDNLAGNMFGLLNAIVEETITNPKRWNNSYEQLPENARNAAEAQDKRNLQNQAQNPSSPPTQK
ncbi:DUF4145 domain-containing protein [Neisseria sp. LNP16475]|uniref:DUF4145 domain-containing protein n=1 Tax=Neisseria mucosa TaxID=488 RepID=UPI0008A22331|nr:DUF4145 domain-containing protein [Neisseria mucosa]